MIDQLTTGQLYSNDDILRSLNLSNAGGIPLALGSVISGEILTASRQNAIGNSPEDDVVADDYAPADGFE